MPGVLIGGFGIKRGKSGSERIVESNDWFNVACVTERRRASEGQNIVNTDRGVVNTHLFRPMEVHFETKSGLRSEICRAKFRVLAQEAFLLPNLKV